VHTNTFVTRVRRTDDGYTVATSQGEWRCQVVVLATGACNLPPDVKPPHRFERTRIPELPPLSLDLRRGEIRSILWATGFRPEYSWLEVPVFDRKGRIRHDGGVVDSPGLYLMGAQFMRRRKSAFIDGAGDDARDLSAHLVSYLDGARADPRAPQAIPREHDVEERIAAPR
jgi:glycine/D-amino acid oxidase-like deaminating enzyme